MTVLFVASVSNSLFAGILTDDYEWELIVQP